MVGYEYNPEKLTGWKLNIVLKEKEMFIYKVTTSLGVPAVSFRFFSLKIMMFHAMAGGSMTYKG